jgi:hypothetical protein
MSKNLTAVQLANQADLRATCPRGLRPSRLKYAAEQESAVGRLLTLCEKFHIMGPWSPAATPTIADRLSATAVVGVGLRVERARESRG